MIRLGKQLSTLLPAAVATGLLLAALLAGSGAPPPRQPVRPLHHTALHRPLLTGGLAAPQVGLTISLFVLLVSGISLGRIVRRSLQSRPRLEQSALDQAALRRRAEAAERRCRQLLDNASDAIFFIGPKDGSLLEINRRGEELLGYSAQEIRTLSPAAIFTGRQLRRYLRLVKQVLKNGYGEDDNLLFRRKDGTFFIGAVHARLGGLGEEQVVHGTLRDVSTLKRIERELRQKNQNLTLLNEIARKASGGQPVPGMLQALLRHLVEAFATAGGGIYLVGDDQNSLYLTAHHEVDDEVLADIGCIPIGRGLAGRVALTGQPRVSADLLKDHRLRSEAVRNAGWRSFQAIPLTAQEKTIGVLFLFRREKHVPQRDEVNLLLAIGRLIGTAAKGGRLFEALQWQNRLTQASNRELMRSRQRLEENLARLEDANRELERLDRMKSNFLALASHELRTPLTCVIAGSELLATRLEGRLDTDDRQAIAAVQEGAQRLESLVQDLLEAARIESQTLYLAKEEVDLPALLEEVGAAFRPVFAERRLSYRMGGIPSPFKLYGDSYYLKQTFSRLLENAVKFTPEGGEIEIVGALRGAADLRSKEAALRPFSPSFFRTDADHLLQVTVRDSGVGIAPEEQLRVFEKFYEVGDITAHFSSRTRFGGKGVGLGLTLVKGMVEAHGGMVWVESAGSAGQPGSAFHVLLPLAASAKE